MIFRSRGRHTQGVLGRSLWWSGRRILRGRLSEGNLLRQYLSVEEIILNVFFLACHISGVSLLYQHISCRFVISCNNVKDSFMKDENFPSPWPTWSDEVGERNFLITIWTQKPKRRHGAGSRIWQPASCQCYSTFPWPRKTREVDLQQTEALIVAIIIMYGR